MFNGAQSFYLDPSAVEGSLTVDVSAFSLYFMYRPPAVDNKTGVQYPGVTAFLTDVVDGVPNLANTTLFVNYARCEWNQVSSSSDASAETIFTFPNPITVKTGQQYAFCWSYDSGEDFLPWVNTKGNFLVGTQTVSPGPSSAYGGNYFLAATVTTQNTTSLNPQNLQTNWTALAGTDAKFRVYLARYAVNGEPVGSNSALVPSNAALFSSNLDIAYANGTTTATMPSPRVENIAFDVQSSVKQSYVGAQRVYQDTIHWPGGGVWASLVTTGSNTVTANSQLSNGAAFSWSTVFGGYTGDKYVVIDYGTSVDVRMVTSIVSNTVIVVDEATTAANSGALMMVSPVAVVDSFNTSILNGKKESLLFMRDSSANSSVRFVPHQVDRSSAAVSSGGSGYSNSDVLFVVGYQNINGIATSFYPAVANLTTNSTGGVTAMNFSNVGAGFVNSAQVHFVVGTGLSNPNSATANTSAGTGLSPNLTFQTTLITEQTNNVFRNSRPLDIDVHSVTPVMNLASAANTTQTSTLTTIYYLANSALTPNGFCTFVGPAQQFPLNLNVLVPLNQLTNIPVVASRSNEFGIHYANGALNDQASGVDGSSNCFSVSFAVTSNNDYVALGPFQSPLLDFGRYIVNDDYTNENTDQGNAVARHISTVFNMTGQANAGLMAEDVRIFLSAWRPPLTDLQVFTRIQNSTDPEAFDSEDWTRLQLQTNNYSTSGYVDLTYGFQGQPNTTLTLPGTVSTANGTNVLTGSNTNWNSTLTVDTLVKVYDPLFANSDYAVVLVTGVTNATSVTVDQAFDSNTELGIGGFELAGRGGLAMDVLGYPHQAFNNPQNDSVVRYYNASEQTFDGFNVLQVKVVFLTPDPHFIPRIHNIRGIALSA